MVRRGVLRAFTFGRALRFSPEAIRETEQMLAVPVRGRKRRRRDDGISPTVKALLEDAG
jgi:hypothetical protein